MSLATGAVVRERFEIRGLLGRGGMGNVFRAFDRELGVEVALKSVRIASPQAFYRLKAEFRTLADLRHRNLVRLGELFGGDDDWFFSMELVEGLDFLHWVRGSSRSGRVHETSRHSSPIRSTSTRAARAVSRSRHGSTKRAFAPCSHKSSRASKRFTSPAACTAT